MNSDNVVVSAKFPVLLEGVADIAVDIALVGLLMSVFGMAVLSVSLVGADW